MRSPAAQWGIVALLFLFLLPLGALTVQCAKGIRQQSAIQAIERLGGHVVPTQGGPSWLHQIAGSRVTRIFDHATLVNLSRTKTTDDDLKRLAQLRHVERLNLSNTNVTDAGITELEGLTGLKALDLSGTRVGDAGIARLRGFNSLEYLYLNETELTDAGLLALIPLQNLRELSVTGTQVSAAAIHQLQQDRPELRLDY